jgi:hypothetical protein
LPAFQKDFGLPTLLGVAPVDRTVGSCGDEEVSRRFVVRDTFGEDVIFRQVDPFGSGGNGGSGFGVFPVVSSGPLVVSTGVSLEDGSAEEASDSELDAPQAPSANIRPSPIEIVFI